MKQAELDCWLAAEAEPSFRAFSERIIPRQLPLLGVRVPKLRQLAKQLARGDWQTFLALEPRSFEQTMLDALVLTAAPGAWFAYPWWSERREAPDYASHVDIHNKIGFDPCELFWGWPPPGVSQDPARVRGTHGRNDQPSLSAASTAALRGAASLADLAAQVRGFLQG